MYTHPARSQALRSAPIESWRNDQRDAGAHPMIMRTVLEAVARISFFQSLYRETQTYIDQALAIPSPNERETVRLLTIAGLTAYEQGHFDQAKHSFEQMLTMCQALDNQAQIRNALNNLGLVAIDRGI